MKERGARTREQLLAAAREVFCERGFFGTRVADIVKKLGFSHGTFYTYFESKIDIFRAVIVEVLDEVHAAGVVHDDSLSEAERIELANRQYIATYSRNVEMLVLITQVATFDESVRKLRLERRHLSVERVAKRIRRLQAEGLANPKIDVHETATALVAMVSDFVHFWLVIGDAFDEDTAVKTLTRIWMAAIGIKADAVAPAVTRSRRSALNAAHRQ